MCSLRTPKQCHTCYSNIPIQLGYLLYLQEFDMLFQHILTNAAHNIASFIAPMHNSDKRRRQYWLAIISLTARMKHLSHKLINGRFGTARGVFNTGIKPVPQNECASSARHIRYNWLVGTRDGTDDPGHCGYSHTIPLAVRIMIAYFVIP